MLGSKVKRGLVPRESREGSEKTLVMCYDSNF